MVNATHLYDRRFPGSCLYNSKMLEIYERGQVRGGNGATVSHEPGIVDERQPDCTVRLTELRGSDEPRIVPSEMDEPARGEMVHCDANCGWEQAAAVGVRAAGAQGRFLGPRGCGCGCGCGRGPRHSWTCAPHKQLTANLAAACSGPPSLQCTQLDKRYQGLPGVARPRSCDSGELTSGHYASRSEHCRCNVPLDLLLLAHVA